MDLALPDLDGWAATQRLKAYPLTQHIPVLAFTAHVTQDDIARALAAGCVAVISKPFEIDGLLSTVAAVLTQPTTQRQRAVGTALQA
jgi:CheY-like chemotaxis protein